MAKHLSKDIELLISEQMRLTKGKQMTEEEYTYIASLLGNKNVLVFGTGHDSNIWREANNDGLIIFLEDNDKWIQDANDVYRVSYTSVLTDADKFLEEYKLGIFDKLKINLPDTVKNTKWDVIIVDAPAGNKSHFPGRMQSIFTAKKLARKNTDIFVHDCDRKVEDLYTKEFFGEPKKQLTKLRHFVYEK